MNSCSYSASKYGICKGELQFYKIKHKKLSLICLKLTQKSLWYQKLFQHASHIKIKQIKLIDMVSIKRKYSYYSLKCLPFVSKHLTNKTSKNYQLISQFGRKNILNRKLSKKTTKIRLTSYVTFLPRVCSSNIYIDFETYIARWQHSMVNRQLLNPRLTTSFS